MSKWTSKKGQQISFLKVQDLTEGPFTGVFVETYTGGKFNTKNHKFKALEDAVIGDNKVSAGDMVIINGCGSLNNQIEQVLEGETTRIEYLGQVEMKTGQFKGGLAHNVEVFTDADADIEDVADYKYGDE